MTVKELINELSRIVDQDSEIVVMEVVYHVNDESPMTFYSKIDHIHGHAVSKTFEGAKAVIIMGEPA